MPKEKLVLHDYNNMNSTLTPSLTYRGGGNGKVGAISPRNIRANAKYHSMIAAACVGNRYKNTVLTSSEYARKDGLDENEPATNESDSPYDAAADGDSMHVSASDMRADFHAVQAL